MKVYQFYKSVLPKFRYLIIEIIKYRTGLRSCSSDSMPYIGLHPKFHNVKITTGHTMMDLCLAPVTGQYISEIINGERKSIPKLEPHRFS